MIWRITLGRSSPRWVVWFSLLRVTWSCRTIIMRLPIFMRMVRRWLLPSRFTSSILRRILLAEVVKIPLRRLCRKIVVLRLSRRLLTRMEVLSRRLPRYRWVTSLWVVFWRWWVLVWMESITRRRMVGWVLWVTTRFWRRRGLMTRVSRRRWFSKLVVRSRITFCRVTL